MTTTHPERVLDGLDAQLASRAQIIRPADPDWDTARRAFNLAIDQKPAAVVILADESDAVAAVRRAAADGLAVHAQSGGHGATPSADGTVLLKTAALQDITIDVTAHRARVGAGVTWGDLLRRLDGTGLVALAGSSPGVSIVGYMLGGGQSWFSRKYGPASRSLRAVELVTPGGDAVRVTAASDPELFWALCGAGGEFGIVTAIEFDLHWEPQLCGGHLLFPAEQAPEVLGATAELMAAAPPELTLQAGVRRFPATPETPDGLRNKAFTYVGVAYLGEEHTLIDLMSPIRGAGTAVRDWIGPLPISRLGEIADEPSTPVPFVDGGIMLRRLDAAAIGLIIAAVKTGGLAIAVVRQLGGALAQRYDDGVVGARDEEFLLHLVGVPSTAQEGRELLETMRALRYGLGDSAADLVPVNAMGPHGELSDAYSADSVARLVALKDERDPLRVVRGNRPI